VGIPSEKYSLVVKLDASTIIHFLNQLQSKQTFKSLVLWPFFVLQTYDEMNAIVESLRDYTQLETLTWINLLAGNTIPIQTTDHGINNDRSAAINNNANDDNDNQITNDENRRLRDRRRNSASWTLDPLLQYLSGLSSIRNVEFALGINCTPNNNNNNSTGRPDGNVDATTTTNNDEDSGQQNISCNRLVQDYITSICPLLRHPYLQTLSLRNVGLTNVFCSCFKDIANETTPSTLRSIDIRYNPHVTIHGFYAMYEGIVLSVATSSRLEYLEMDYIRFYESTLPAGSPRPLRSASTFLVQGHVDRLATTNRHNDVYDIDSLPCPGTLSSFEELKEQLDFILRLNRSGQRKLEIMLNGSENTEIKDNTPLWQQTSSITTKNLKSSSHSQLWLCQNGLVEIFGNVHTTRYENFQTTVFGRQQHDETGDLNVLYHLIRRNPTCVMILR
jgi:hypothetical protein